MAVPMSSSSRERIRPKDLNTGTVYSGFINLNRWLFFAEQTSQKLGVAPEGTTPNFSLLRSLMRKEDFARCDGRQGLLALDLAHFFEKKWVKKLSKASR